ncbi:MAG: TolC family protein, partial [bacterium]|nr:TolC family protein [bacterium]
WDFGKTTANIKMEKFYKIGAEYEFMDSLCKTLFEVKQKYYNLLRTKAIREITLENIHMQKELGKIMEGKHPDSDNANVEMSLNTIQYISADDAYKNAKVDLNNTMYLDRNINFDIKQTDTFAYEVPDDIKSWENKHKEHINHTFGFSREASPEIAYKNSPDLKVLIATRKAMEQSLKYVKRMYLPEINANVGYGYNHTIPTSNNSLMVGVSMDSSVNLMELKHSIKGADAQLNLAQNEIDLFKKDLYYEIQRAYNNIDRVEEQLPHARENVFFTKKLFEIALSNYKSNQNEVDYVAVQDAKLNYINSNISYVEKLYEYNMALIQLEMAMHCHIVDIHHKSGHAIHHHSDELINNLIKALECKEINKKGAKKKSLLFGNNDDIDEDIDL